MFLCATRGFCVLSGVGAVPSDDDLEGVTLSAYRELNKSSGLSISKSEFTKWVLRFAAGRGAGGEPVAMSRSSEVTIESALEQFSVVTPSKESSPGHEEPNEATGGGSAGDEENNPIVEHQGVEAQQVEADMMHDKSSACDAAYQVQEEVAQTNADEEEKYTEAALAKEAAPDHEVGFELPPVTAESAEGEEISKMQPDEAQEYEQEFAPETPRNADSVAAVEHTFGEERERAAAEELESSAGYESDLMQQEAVGIAPSTESSASLGEQVPVANAEREEEGKEVSAPAPSEQTLEPEAIAETELPVLEADADYEVSSISCRYGVISHNLRDLFAGRTMPTISHPHAMGVKAQKQQARPALNLRMLRHHQLNTTRTKALLGVQATLSQLLWT